MCDLCIFIHKSCIMYFNLEYVLSYRFFLLSWSRDGHKLVSASTDNIVSQWDVLSGDCDQRFRFPSPILKVQYHPRDRSEVQGPDSGGKDSDQQRHVEKMPAGRSSNWPPAPHHRLAVSHPQSTCLPGDGLWS